MKIALTTLFILLLTSLHAQIVEWNDNGSIISAADNGNSMHAAGGTIEKRDGAGNIIFSHTFGPLNTVSYIASNSSGRYVIAGRLQQDQDFDFSAGTWTVTNTANNDYFYAIYDNTGALQHVETFTTTVGNNLFFYDVEMEEDGTMLLTGNWEGDLNYGGWNYNSISQSAVFAMYYDPLFTPGFEYATFDAAPIESGGIARSPSGEVWIAINAWPPDVITSSGFTEFAVNGIPVTLNYGGNCLVYSLFSGTVIEIQDNVDKMEFISDIDFDANDYMHVLGATTNSGPTTLATGAGTVVANQGGTDLAWSILEPWILASGTPAATSSFSFIHTFGTPGEEALYPPFFGVIERPRLDVESGSIYIGANFEGQVTPIPGTATTPAPTYGLYDAVLHQFSIDALYQTASLESVLAVGGQGQDAFTSMDFDQNDGIYLGIIGNNVDIDPSPVTNFVPGNGTIVKYDGSTSKIEGIVYYDLNGNGTQDAGEEGVFDASIEVDNGTYSFFVSTDDDGYYAANVPTGNYTVSCDLQNSGYFNGSNPADYTLTGLIPNTLYSGNDFGLTPTPNVNDLAIVINPITPVRPGFEVLYEVIVRNNGTNTQSADANFTFDNDLSYVSATTTPTTQNANNITWTINNMAPGADTSIIVTVQAPAALPLGILILSNAQVNPTIGDAFVFDNTNEITQISQGSYDPNDKSVNPKAISPQFVADEEYLNYLVRFQNTGTDTAFTVIIRDTLDPFLQHSTLEILSASDPLIPTMYFDETSGLQIMEFKFENILLPDSTTNEPESNGYVSYRVKLDTGFTYGDISCNKADIYFDYNAPITTNTVKTKLSEIVISETSSDPLCNGDCNGTIDLAPTGGTGVYDFYWSDTLNGQNLCAGTYNAMVRDSVGNISFVTVTLMDAPILNIDATVVNASNSGANDGEITIIPTGGTAPYQYSIDGGVTYIDTPIFNGLGSQVYTICIQDFNGCTICQDTLLDAESGLQEFDQAGIVVFPNPNDGQFSIDLNGQNGIAISVLDNMGRVVHSIKTTENDPNIVSVDLRHLATGVYTILLKREDGTILKTQMIKQ